MGLFKNATKAQRLEVKRQRALVKELHQILLACSSAQDMESRVKVVYEQINAEGQRRLDELKKQMAEDTFQSLGLKAQEGKGQDIEQKIIELLAPEKLALAQGLLEGYIMAHGSAVRQEMLKRGPDSLDMGLLD